MACRRTGRCLDPGVDLTPARRSLAGWGRYQPADASVYRPAGIGEVAAALALEESSIARGNGRAYGDAAANPAATVELLALDRFIDLDAATGMVTCEAGLLLTDLIDALLPRGWWPSVTPGTKLVTIGGMIAADVHGKNHHGAGSFCDHLAWIDLAVGDGRVLRCSRNEHPALFAATCGGMGLTGVIVRASFALLPVETASIRQRTVRAGGLVEAIAVFEEALDWTYSVAWIDCLATGRSLGRSAVFLGEHARCDELPVACREQPFARPARRALRVPVDLPRFALNRGSVTLFNRLYWSLQQPGEKLVDIDPYFYPLDTLIEWNRIYGRDGFVQYQCVLPLDASEPGYTRILGEIVAAGGSSFLAVLKRLGRQSFGMLSFPMPGYTLALDFQATAKNLALLDRLDAITRDHGGRLYLAKDGRASAPTIAAGYPRLAEFRDVRRRWQLDRRFSSLLSERLCL